MVLICKRIKVYRTLAVTIGMPHILFDYTQFTPFRIPIVFEILSISIFTSTYNYNNNSRI